MDGPALALAFLLAAAIAGLAWWRGSLAAGGAVAATVVGTLVFAGGGPVWGAALIFFFVSSSALGRIVNKPKAEAETLFAKGQRRDAWQVAANGGIGALLALGHGLIGGPAWEAAFVGTLAAVTADTWATEFGTLSRRPPRLITTLAAVAPGTSGGVTAIGLAASLAGAFAIGVIAALAGAGKSPAALVFLATAAGLAGSLADSALGAWVQATYHCDACDQPTEARHHRCGAASRRVGGIGAIDNDVVNLIAAAVGAAVGAILGTVL